jgi:formylglycine-generating enzyme required for sulfatase activity
MRFIFPWLILTLGLATLATRAAAPAETGVIRVDLGEGVDMTFVRIPSAGLWVARHEVTNRQFRRYNAAHVSPPHFLNEMDEDAQPAVFVSWRQALDYTEWMNRRFAAQIPLGNAFRLPLEREWAVFAACGDNRPYPWGRTWPPPNDWNYRGEEGVWRPMRPLPTDQVIRGHTDDFITTGPVQKSGRNDWGLYGVGGNAWEWCLDVFEGTSGARVVRGASWHNHLEPHLRLAYRTFADPDARNAMIGFRVVIGRPVPVPADGL